MRRGNVPLAIVTGVGAFAAMSCVSYRQADARADALAQKVRHATSLGAQRSVVEQTLDANKIPHLYQASENAIVGSRMPVGQVWPLWDVNFNGSPFFRINGKVRRPGNSESQDKVVYEHDLQRILLC